YRVPVVDVAPLHLRGVGKARGSRASRRVGPGIVGAEHTAIGDCEQGLIAGAVISGREREAVNVRVRPLGRRLGSLPESRDAPVFPAVVGSENTDATHPDNIGIHWIDRNGVVIETLIRVARRAV